MIIRISVDSRGTGREIEDELAKHRGMNVAAVFPLGQVYHEHFREFFVLLTEDE
jgi:hypothetical protein